MDKCYIERLALITLDDCNLNCAHCIREKKCKKVISDEIIDKTFEQIIYASTVAIAGGEPTLAVDRIEKIIDAIIKRHIKLDEFTVTINGTIYSEELLRLLDEIEKYIGDGMYVMFAISLDKYHVEEMNKLGLMESFIENFNKYKESKHFAGTRELDFKLFREGNATNLSDDITIPLRPMKKFVTYSKIGTCCIGPLVTINTDGIVTECDASYDNQRTIYNYGNVLEDSIENIVLNNGAEIVPNKKFHKITYKELKRYQTYNE